MNIEAAMMNVEQQEVWKEQSREFPTCPPLDEERAAVSDFESHEELEEGELPPEELPVSTTLNKSEEDEVVVEEASRNRVELSPYEFSTDEVDVVISNIIHELTSAPTPLPSEADAEGGSRRLNVEDSPDMSELPSISNALPPEDLPATLPSPGKKRSKRGRPWKKHGGKHKLEKELDDLQVEVSQLSVNADIQREDHQDSPMNAHPVDLELKPSDVAQCSAPEVQDVELRSVPETTEDEKFHENQSTSLGLEETVVNAKLPPVEALLLHSKSGRSLGRWADVTEDSDIRAVDAEVERSRTEDMRADVRNTYKEEQEIRGKSQQSPRELVSQASRELNWRRKPVDTRPLRLEQQTRNNGKFDVDPRKDDQDFRSRVQHGAEPQATHKNWVPRRGLQSFDSEGGRDQNKNRGKGKQSREAGAQVQSPKDFARQKFEADLKVKKEELLQKSKQKLRAEFQKTKRIEQARKGKDELEMELERNLIYESDELFYLNPM